MPKKITRRKYNNCKHCKKRIEYAPCMSVKKYMTIQYCSRECMYEHAYIIINCKHCGKTIKTTNKRKLYCNQTCYFEHMRYKKTICTYCGTKLNGDKRFAFGKKYYCSHKCFEDDFGRDNVRYCYKCNKPIYSKSGSRMDYKYQNKHNDCSIFKDT